MNNRIRKLRKELNLTLDKFGEKIGLKKSSLSQIENGRCAITEQTIKSICREFNVNENWLRTGEGDMFIQMSEEEELMQWAGKFLSSQSTDFQHRFVKMLMELTDDQWQLFEDKIKELASNLDNLKKKDE